MFVRWIKVIDSDFSISESIIYEVSLQGNRELVCEHFKSKPAFPGAKIGLLRGPKSVTKRFNGDCGSEYINPNNPFKLHMTRNPRQSRAKYRDAWVFGENCFDGIVLTENLVNFNKGIRKEILKAAKFTELPLYKILMKNKRVARVAEIDIENINIQ